ncbi:MAG: hypothetical protein HEQ38_19120 [Gemmatimonas sp.]|jgi:hypothetical protein|uniref:hypothetical protein n=1 Tax=Gemmatimonas sp. TaxID=1962908 RepID=UPI0031BDA86C|nr:hypothetical protein [Gemmatimonas sp.]
MSSARREFLKYAGITASAFAAFPGVASAADAPPAPTPSEAARIRAHAAAWDESQQAEEWDTSWTKHITGAHKAMFDVPEVEGGVGVFRSGLWQQQCKDVLKVPASAVSSVMVLRHNGIVLAMNQEFWTTYSVGEAEKLKDDDGKILKFNPALPDGEHEMPAPFSNYLLDKQISAGAIALGCNMAFRSMVMLVAKQDKVNPADARKKALSMLVPGVIIQPSGIFANVLAQQAGCVFVRAV